MDSGLSVLDDEFKTRRLRVIQDSSPSQIGSFETCQRFWFFASVEGDRADQKPHQVRGTHIDVELQHYYKSGGEIRNRSVRIKMQDRDESRDENWTPLIHEIVKHLPSPDHEVFTQAQGKFLAFDGGPMVVAKPDFIYEVAPGWIDIPDLKSSTDFTYSLSLEQVLTNLQLVTYAKYGYDVLNADKVSSGHVYGRTKWDYKKKVPAKARAHRSLRPHPFISDEEGCKCAECKTWLSNVNNGRVIPDELVVFEREHVEAEWSKHIASLQQMAIAAREVKRGQDLPPSTQHCQKLYGYPCPYREKCGFSEFGKMMGALFSTQREKTMENAKGQSKLLQMLRGKNGGGVETPAAKETPKEPVVAPKASVEETPAAAKPSSIRSLFAKKPATEPAAEKPIAEQTPGELGLEGYKPGQLCNGKGYYKNAKTSGFIDVEEGHHCANCPVEIEPDQVLPPETVNQRTSTPEEVEAADTAARTKGKAKKEPTAATAKPKKPPFIKIECTTCKAEVPMDEYEAHVAEHEPETLANKIESIADNRGESEMAAAASNLADEVRQKAKSAPSVAEVLDEKPAPKAIPTPKRDPKVRELSEKLRAEMAENGKPSTRKAPLVKPWIFVDALPVKMPDELVAAAVTLEEWLDPLTEMVATANDVTDIRLLSYGVAKGGLATAMRESIESCPAVLLISSKHPDAALALEVLAPHGYVVRGVAA